MDHEFKGVEFNTQRCGKPLIPLGSAPGRSLAGTRSLRHKNSSISSGGFQIWAHLPGCTSTVVWPCHTVRGCSRKKALQPTSLYWVSGLHFASLGQSLHNLNTVAAAPGENSTPCRNASVCEECTLTPLTCNPDAVTLLGHP